jgi:hypothetical protein
MEEVLYLWKKFFIYGRSFYFREEVFIFQELSRIIYEELLIYQKLVINQELVIKKIIYAELFTKEIILFIKNYLWELYYQQIST